VVEFASADLRDAARDRLDGLSGEILGQRFEVNDLLSHPASPIPSRRFLKAAERLLGKSLGTPIGSSSISLNLHQPLASDEVLRRKAAALHAIRKLCSDLERIVMQLDKPVGYAYFSDDDDFMEAEIVGGREGVEQLAVPPDLSWNDPYRMFRVARILNLQPHEHLSHLRIHFRDPPTSKDPVIEALARLHLHAARFNTYQRLRYKVILDADWLERSLTEAARRNLEDARALAANVPLGDTTLSPEPQTTHLLIELNRPSPGWVPGARSMATSIVVPNPEGQEEVRVTLAYQRDVDCDGVDHAARSAWIQQLGLRRDLRDYPHGLGDLLFVLADMLGHKKGELRFAYPENDPGESLPW
jgi:hypothetical protein